MTIKEPICKKDEKLQYIAAPIRPVPGGKKRKAKATKKKGPKKRTCRTCK